MDVNLHGAFLCCRAVLGAMLSQRAGVIVNIASGAAVRTGFSTSGTASRKPDWTH